MLALPLRYWFSALVASSVMVGGLRAATLSDPAVDRYNVRLGTQTFAGLYHFTTNTLLLETAQAIQGLGSDSIKFYLGSAYPRQYGITLPTNITNLLTLARDEPSCRAVFDLAFRHYIVWAYPFANGDNAWANGYSAAERVSDYRELYDLTIHLLTQYNGSGKTFYLGHWEGDGYFMPWTTNPPPAAIQGMIDWLNNRQQAIDDAKSATGFTNVNVFGYAEVNRVRDAMVNGPTNNLRVINAVVPYVTNLDFLSYSSYDAMDLGASDLYATLDYIESKLPPAKAASITGERLWIGEYGWGGTQPPAQQEPTTRAYLQRLLNWGRQGLPYLLFWEIYNNEPGKNYCLIDSSNLKVASYYLHQRFINAARLLTAQFRENQGRLPSDAEFVGLVSPLLNQPLPAPVSLTLSNVGAGRLSPTTARLSGLIAQGLYGDEQAAVWVYWGRQDGGTTRSAWEQGQAIGVNTHFNPATFNQLVTNLATQTNYYFRFYATNASGEAWAPASSRFATLALDPSEYAYQQKITFIGYDHREQLGQFPVLIQLGPSLPGFAYRQFASAGGGDLRFTDAGGFGLIPHEIDEWNINGISSVWVQLPQLSSSNDFIWAYWGNPLATNPPAWTTDGSVWHPAYNLVWHLQQTTLPITDSAGLHPALAGRSPASTAGVVGRAGNFDGLSDFLDAGPIDLGDAFTLSAWVRVTPGANDIQTLWANKIGGWNANGLAWYINSYNSSDLELRLETGDGATGLTANTAPNAVTAGQWHDLAAAVDRRAGTARLYVDGAEASWLRSVVTDFANQSDLELGRFINGSFYFHGAIDEVRIAARAVSSNWVWASWMTVASNAVLTRYASPVPIPPVLSFQPSASQLELTWLRGTLQTAPQVGGPYSDLPNASSPYTFAPSAAAQFFRVQAP